MPFYNDAYYCPIETKRVHTITAIGLITYNAIHDNAKDVNWRPFRQEGYWAAEAIVRQGTHERPTGFFVVGNTKDKLNTPTTKFAVVVSVRRHDIHRLERKILESLRGR